MRELVKAFITNTGGIEDMSEAEIFRWVALQVGYTHPYVRDIEKIEDKATAWLSLDNHMYNKLIKVSI